MKPRKGFVSALSDVFSSTLRSRLALSLGLASILALIASWNLWPLLNETDMYYLLYVVDFINYAVFLVFYACISRATVSRDSDPTEQRGWVSVFVAVAILSIGNIALQDFKDGLNDTMLRYWTTIGFNFVSFLFFFFLIIFSVTRIRLLSTLTESAFIFLRAIHLFALYYLLIVAIGTTSTFLLLLVKDVEMTSVRLYNDILGAVLRYLGSFVIVALTLMLTKRRKTIKVTELVSESTRHDVEIGK